MLTDFFLSMPLDVTAALVDYSGASLAMCCAASPALRTHVRKHIDGLLALFLMKAKERKSAAGLVETMGVFGWSAPALSAALHWLLTGLPDVPNYSANCDGASEKTRLERAQLVAFYDSMGNNGLLAACVRAIRRHGAMSPDICHLACRVLRDLCRGDGCRRLAMKHAAHVAVVDAIRANLPHPFVQEWGFRCMINMFYLEDENDNYLRLDSDPEFCIRAANHCIWAMDRYGEQDITVAQRGTVFFINLVRTTKCIPSTTCAEIVNCAARAARRYPGDISAMADFLDLVYLTYLIYSGCILISDTAAVMAIAREARDLFFDDENIRTGYHDIRKLINDERRASRARVQPLLIDASV